MKKWFLTAAAILAVITLAGCASSGGGSKAPPVPIPEGAERVMLENGAYAIFRFDLPSGAKWGDYNKITADYMVDERNIKRPIRNGNNVRLMGNYKEEQFALSGKIRVFNLNGEGANNANGPYIMDNAPRTYASMGAVVDQWFTVEYDITGSKAHDQFVKANIPAPNAAGPFFFGVGIPGSGEGAGITQFIKNVTLHHASDPELNVVSTGSGFEEPTFVSFFPVQSSRVSP
ncbi:MAG: hypothetical protein LBI04_09975 [Treponema sp.]|jgi:hypothetical protein|nr:hypothetical protein [Treponema sp.]